MLDKGIFVSPSVLLAMRYKAYLFFTSSLLTPWFLQLPLNAFLLRKLLNKVVKHFLYLYESFALLKLGPCWHIFLSAVTQWYKTCLNKHFGSVALHLV